MNEDALIKKMFETSALSELTINASRTVFLMVSSIYIYSVQYLKK